MVDILYFAETYCEVWDKVNQKIIPFKTFVTQNRVLKGFEENRFSLVSKYRQGGITSCTELFLAHKINFTPNIKVAIVANKRALAEKAVFNINKLIMGLPDWLRNETGVKKSNHYKIYENLAELQAFAASGDGLRGFSPEFLFIDEVAWLDYGDAFWTASRGSLGAGGKVFMVSTPKGMDPLYWETYRGSKDGANDFFIIEVDWYEDPRYNIGLEWRKGEEVIKDRNLDNFKGYVKDGYKPWSPWFEEECRGFNYDPKKIAQELEHKFLGSGGNMVSEKYILEMEDMTVRNPIRTEYIDQGMWIWEDPIPDVKYVITSDVSSGNGDDYSTVIIFKIVEGYREQVAEYMGKIPPEVLGREIIDRYGRLYNCATAVVDISGGVGVPTVSELLQLDYPDIHASHIRSKPIRDRLAKFLKNPDDPNIPGFTISSNRRLILDELTRQIRMDEIIIRSNRLVNEFKTFVWNDAKSRFDHTRSTHDDLIFAMAMGLYVAQYSISKNIDDEKRRIAMLNSWVVNNPEQVDRKYLDPAQRTKNLPIRGKDDGNNFYPPAFYSY